MLILLYFKFQQGLTYSFIRELMSENRTNENASLSFTPIIPKARTTIVPIIPIVRPPAQISDRKQPSISSKESGKLLIGENNFSKVSRPTFNNSIATVLNVKDSIQNQFSSHNQIESMFESKEIVPTAQNLQEKLKRIYSQYLKLFEQKYSIEETLKKAKQERNTLLNNFYLTKKQMKDGEPNSFDNKNKRVRRTAVQISRDFQCPEPQCGKSYGSENSLMQHLRLKHQVLHKQLQTKTKKERNQKSNHSQQLSQIPQSQSSCEPLSKKINKNEGENFVLKELNVLRQPVISLIEPKKQLQAFLKNQAIYSISQGQRIKTGQKTNQNHQP